MNYKTVQSMGYEKKIFEKYRDYLQPQVDAASKRHCKAGIAFGLG